MIRRRKVSQLLRFFSGVFCSALFLFVVARSLNGEHENGLHSPGNVEVEEGVTRPLGKKIDWHNYDLIARESERTGPGEHGKSVIIPTEENNEKDELYKTNGFNALASDKIALDRAVKDIRHEGCKKKRYFENLPTVSVIVPFHNEHWTTLLRTAMSVLVRSPPALIKEIILVDDFSTKDFLKGKLDDYIKEHMQKVRVIRAPKREGLIRARLLGAQAATGSVLIFLDSHSEPNVNWLPPLLEPIAENYRTTTCPFIDIIDYETFEYRAQDEGARGAFDWELYYKRLPLLPADIKNPTEPFKSPVMAGGLFAISRKFFWELGGYDEGLDVWGGEQYELSFKIWQCGGMMVDVPCSRIGHIYRKFAPFSNPGVGDFVGRNYKRVAEVWMDEYAEFLYNKRPHYRNIETGNLSKQRKLRDTLKCKSFKWFMTEVAFDLMDRYPPVEPPNYAWGEIRNIASNQCMDTRFKGQNERFLLEPCIKDNTENNGEQSFELTWHKDIRPKNRAVCFDVSTSDNKSPIVLYNCHNSQGNQQWRYTVETKQLFHPVSGKCADCDPERREIFVSDCDSSKLSQQWLFEHFNSTLLAKLIS
ncbi:putative polypeptide N-acetylgalactosaminyltransferase 10 [Hypsibius exemplaris]|uniref:Polypeptide N-acetylgalactosaminyltransferase n=1 Tax=Hypsibius exemplaris TaxID=2072580 RepID=A0A1W0WCD2_HYPEX|nr:putative polypeptide N-acetylgalactosaminyltransferase 10 [Hypsibius exemplaris]